MIIPNVWKNNKMLQTTNQFPFPSVQARPIQIHCGCEHHRSGQWHGKPCKGTEPGGGIGHGPLRGLGEQRIHNKYPPVMTNIAMENGHRNSGFPHEKWWFSTAMLNYQRVYGQSHDYPLVNYMVKVYISRTRKIRTITILNGKTHDFNDHFQ